MSTARVVGCQSSAGQGGITDHLPDRHTGRAQARLTPHETSRPGLLVL